MDEIKLYSQLNKEEAIKIAESRIWETWNNEEIVAFQLHQKRLCMDFSKFHEAMENVLGRPVYTHEFMRPDLLEKEFLKEKPKTTLEEILRMLPKEKTVVIIK